MKEDLKRTFQSLKDQEEEGKKGGGGMARDGRQWPPSRHR